MGQIFKTSPAKNGKKPHTHLVYVGKNGNVLVSEVEGHTHEVVMSPDGSGMFSLAPDPYDGHAHETIGEVDVKIGKKKTEKEEEIVGRVHTLFKTGWEVEGDSIEDGQESEKFYAGEQWDEDIRNDLHQAHRACITINYTERNVDKLVGYQRQQRADIRYLPVEGGDQRVCDILNAWSKSVLEACTFEMVESDVFEDQVIAGRGVFNIYMDFSNNIEGDPIIEKFPWDQIVVGPHEKRDMSDAEYVVKFQHMSLARLKARYPKLKDSLESTFTSMANGKSEDFLVSKIYQGDAYAQSEKSIPMSLASGVQAIDVALKEMRVLELQEKVYEDVPVIVDPEEEWFLNAFGWNEKDLKQIETIPGLQIVDVKRTKLRITRVVGDLLLSDENPADVPVDDFFIVPVYAKKKKHKFWGKVESGKDPQRVINKRSSQLLDLGDRAINYGWFVDDMTFRTEADKRKFKEIASTPGFVADVNSLQNLPAKVEGGRFPSELANMHDMSKLQLEEIQGIDPTSNAGANTSASAIMQAEKTVLVGNEYLFDNLKFAKKKLGKLLIGICQKYYTPKRIYRMIANQAAAMAPNQQQMQMMQQQQAQSPTPIPPSPQQQGMMIGGKPFDSYTEEEILALLETSDLSKYDVVVGEAQWSPTQRIATLTILQDMASKGAPIPMDMMVEMTDMPEDVKQRTIQGIQQQQQMQSAAEMGKNETEIQKTLIGQGLFPPKVLEQQGIKLPQPQQGTPQDGAPQMPPMPQGGYGGGPGGLI